LICRAKNRYIYICQRDEGQGLWYSRLLRQENVENHCGIIDVRKKEEPLRVRLGSRTSVMKTLCVQDFLPKIVVIPPRRVKKLMKPGHNIGTVTIS